MQRYEDLDGSKIFNDAVHSHFSLKPLVIRVLDCPQVQRLREIKQLGSCYLVFPSASHNRFEHCLGTAYLASIFVKHLRSQQPELHITEQDELCVTIAALCHDLGHGPFSHMFDREFIRRANPSLRWEHEMTSVDMFDFLLADNNLIPEFEKNHLTATDIIFIKEIILGFPLEKKEEEGGESVRLLRTKSRENWQFRGRGRDKAFLYEIVANKRNGIDVDKFDYFMRDCLQLNIKWSFDCLRLMKFSRVCWVGDERHICFAEKEAYNIFELFHTRFALHKRAYQHRVARVLELMFVDVMVLADPYLRVTAEDGTTCRLSETPKNIKAFAAMTDCIFHQIEFSSEPELAPARALMKDIRRRKLYSYVGEFFPKDDTHFGRTQCEKIREELVADMEADTLEDDVPPSSSSQQASSQANQFYFDGTLTPFVKEDVIVSGHNINYGMDTKNPVDYVPFYSKSNPNVASYKNKRDITAVAPTVFEESFVRVYCRKGGDVHRRAQRAFDKWIAKQRPATEEEVGPSSQEASKRSRH